MIYYTCVGDVRNNCGRKHRSAGAAARCCRKDHRAVQRKNGGASYSDRAVRAVEDGIRRRLTWDEQSQLERKES